MIEAFRVDGHTASAKFPYRVRIGGKLLLTVHGEPRKFRTLAEAIKAGASEQKEIL